MQLFTADSLQNGILALIGTVTCLYYLVKYSWELAVGVRTYVLAKVWRKNLTSYGEWAVVTGATAGIGKAYANELARRGFNVVLISRSLEKLRATAEEIEQQHGKQTKIVQADFTCGAEIYGPIEVALKDLDIGILVNNVGKSYKELPCYLLDVPDVEKAILDIMNCNVLSVLMMTRIILPHMLKRKKGIIINISSEAGTHPHPLITMYSSTKVFVDFFSRALNAEYKPNGIIIQCVLPLMVSTNLTHDMETNFFVRTADDYAQEALNTVGIRERTNGCWSHAMQHFFLERLFPEWLRLTQFSINKMKKYSERRLPLVEKWRRKYKTM
ncbi:hydroxysteroid (20-beta) dehydrogenase 2 isoform X1 [Scyliorhinus canicula]|uniref:hydroxysteroid (20-beta) dehydrogenase 2 isoform X1 n=1 Tax=Scyliorhinus canicula TaxID=7830 RepID=UPI0018F4703F|nr:hydroxysteroid (20-beta) dehydrogenase 2 isoform X1 [Scyliorhinus canicula]XP_038642721.1 hydroxysteroid (20-beta) dehydrogenase 2 isoform X1 [Scyliorhinus canicula]